MQHTTNLRGIDFQLTGLVFPITGAPDLDPRKRQRCITACLNRVCAKL